MRNNSLFIIITCVLQIFLVSNVQSLETADLEQSYSFIGPKLLRTSRQNISFSCVQGNYLIKEHTLFMKVTDKAFQSFAPPCYRLIFEKEGKIGAVQIVLSVHSFPFCLLPVSVQKVILSGEYLVHELSSEDNNAPIIPSTVSYEILKKGLLKKPSSLNWFDSLSVENKNRLKHDDELIHALMNISSSNGVPANIGSLFNQFHPGIFFVILVDKIYESHGTMDSVGTSFYQEWEGLEPASIHAHTILEMLEQSMDDFLRILSLNDQDLFSTLFQAGCALLLQETQQNDYSSTENRSLYWINNSILQVLKPQKLGVMMFGINHAEGENGILTFIRKTLSVSSKPKYLNGVRFLKLEKLRKRTWIEVLT